jgi:polyphosphate kinase
LSENIEAISIVDKFLEHSRILIFCNNNEELYFITSADLMTRNLDHRVEVACPIFDPKIKKLLKKLIELQMNDNVEARFLTEHKENEYKRDSNPRIKSQEVIYQHYKKKLLNISSPDNCTD